MKMEETEWFPGVWILYFDVSEHCSVFVGRYVCVEFYTHLPAYEDGTDRMIPRRLNFIFRCFRTLFYLRRQGGACRILNAPTCLRRLNRQNDSSAPEFFIPTFRNTLFYLRRQVGVCRILNAPTCLRRLNRQNDSSTSEFYIPTFRNTLSVTSS